MERNEGRKTHPTVQFASILVGTDWCASVTKAYHPNFLFCRKWYASNWLLEVGIPFSIFTSAAGEISHPAGRIQCMTIMAQYASPYTIGSAPERAMPANSRIYAECWYSAIRVHSGILRPQRKENSTHESEMNVPLLHCYTAPTHIRLDVYKLLTTALVCP